MKDSSKYYQPLTEDMKFEALSKLREIQSSLISISFLEVISIMKDEDPLRKDVLKFQDNLDKLALSIQEFISKAKDNVDFQDSSEPSEPSEKDNESKDNGNEKSSTMNFRLSKCSISTC